MADVLSFKCPCCTAALSFSGGTGEMTCEYCGASFTMEQARAAQEAEREDAAASDMTWTSAEPALLHDEQGKVSGFLCTSCGAELVADETTAATECPYCGNNAILPQAFDGVYRPDLVVPFAVDKKAAQEALRNFYRGKKLLPPAFTEESRVENMTGLYVPFWLMSCHAEGWAAFEGTRSKRWEDAQYRYEKEDHYRVVRRGGMQFERIPADASTKMDDKTMDSLEPYDLSRCVPYDAAYFSGCLSDRYDLQAGQVQPRASERVEQTFLDKMRQDAQGDYERLSDKGRSIQISDTRTEYAMLPVWMLSTKYDGQIYSFAMNGQTGQVAGSLPVDRGQYLKHFSLAAAIAALLTFAVSFFLAGGVSPAGLAAALVIGVISGWIYGSSLKRAMNTVVGQSRASSYLLERTVRMGSPTDRFLFTKTNRTPKSQPAQTQGAAAAQTQAAPRPAAAPRPQSAPRPTAAKPAQSIQRPTAAKPAQSTQRPTAAKPAQSIQRPTAAKPAQSTQRPTAAKPAQSTQRPTAGKPAQSTQRPTAVKPAQRGKTPTKPGGTSDGERV